MLSVSPRVTVTVCAPSDADELRSGRRSGDPSPGCPIAPAAVPGGALDPATPADGDAATGPIADAARRNVRRATVQGEFVEVLIAVPLVYVRIPGGP
jgi:ADP-ribose pyrophosphatase YjhB (NUDIX family)